MATIRCDGDWVQFDNEIEHQCFQDQQEDDDEEEEALSLCDLPTNNIQTDTSSKTQDNVTDDFQFGPCHRRSPQNMCSAEDVFFQGRILPLTYSVSSDESTRKINRSASMSVVRSNENEYGYRYGYGYKPKVRNLFHSHPSPSPQIRTQSFRMSSHSNPKTTSLWSFLQVGLVKPQEIGLSDLKNRSKRFGSHNSNSSSNSSSMNSTNEQNFNNNNQNQNKGTRKNTKKKPRMFFGGCKCTAGSIDQMVKDRVSKKTTKEENMSFCLGNSQVSEESTMIGEGKQTASRHRTFEWLKQLSIAAPSEA